jgi:hypothetical protein
VETALPKNVHEEVGINSELSQKHVN